MAVDDIGRQFALERRRLLVSRRECPIVPLRAISLELALCDPVRLFALALPLTPRAAAKPPRPCPGGWASSLRRNKRLRLSLSRLRPWCKPRACRKSDSTISGQAIKVVSLAATI